MRNINIGIIDDTPMIIKSLEIALFSSNQPNFSVLFTLNSLTELDQFKNSIHEPDVIICDINMPKITGIEGLPLLKKRFPNCMIIMHSDDDDKFTIIEAIHAGAHGYMQKGLNKEELFYAILKVVEGCLYISPILTKKIFEIIEFQTYRYGVLTPRESQIVDGITKGLSYKMLAFKLNISINTVREHIKRIYKKLNINSKEELVSIEKNINHAHTIA
jgi:DNA-binding NarL/FixJ family response regulator